MPPQKVLQIYNLLDKEGVKIWVDGGWGVDALLEQQTREHADLDIAIDHTQETKMLGLLDTQDYKVVQTNEQTKHQYVLGDGAHLIDVHVFGFDEAGNNVYGIKYSKESLTGTGKINGHEVRCISPEWAVKFHQHAKMGETDRHDLRLLSEKFGICLPAGV